MDVFKPGVKIGSSFQGRLGADGVDLFDQFCQIISDGFRGRTNLIFARHIVMFFEGTRPFAIGDIAALVISSLGQSPMDGSDQGEGEGLLCENFTLEQLVASLLVLLLKECPGAAGVVDDFSVFKNLTGVVIIDLGVLDFAE